MKRILYAALFFVPIHSFGADFRVLDLGQSCENVQELEASLGSQPESKIENKEYSFTGTILDMTGRIEYICKDGKFVRGVAFVKFKALDEAKEFYFNSKSKLIDRYGPPTLDLSNKMVDEEAEKHGIKFDDIEKLTIMWNIERTIINFSVLEPSVDDRYTSVGLNVSPNNN